MNLNFIQSLNWLHWVTQCALKMRSPRPIYSVALFILQSALISSASFPLPWITSNTKHISKWSFTKNFCWRLMSWFMLSILVFSKCDIFLKLALHISHFNQNFCSHIFFTVWGLASIRTDLSPTALKIFVLPSLITSLN